MVATETVLFTAEQIKTAPSIKAAADMVRHNLAASNNWLYRGLLAIHAKQTSTEQCWGTTRDNNGVGFASNDAELLTSYVRQIEKFNATPPLSRRFTQPLSGNQLNWARRKMLKYSGQLARISRGKL
jgi:hypothetical protein